MRLLEKLRNAHSVKVGMLVMCSRVLGFVRDSVFAMFFGLCWQFDAFITANRIPNMLRDLLAEGALSSAVVTRLGHVDVEEGRERTKQVVRRLFAFWGVALVLVSLAGILVAPAIAGVMGWGFASTPGKQELTLRLTRIIFPYIALVGMGALTMGVLHHLRIFGWPSSASIFANVTIILCTAGYFLVFGKGDADRAILWLSFAVLLAGLVQWLSPLPGLRGTGVSLRPDFHLKDPEIWRVLFFIGPAVLGVAAVQINVLVNHAYASNLGDGAVSCIYYAFRIMQLPIGVVGVAVSTVLLPALAAHHARAEAGAFSQRLEKALTDVALFIMPAVAGLLVMGSDIIALLYQRGQFSEAATRMTWLTLAGYLPGILAYAWNKNLLQAFYARNDVRFPVAVSVASIAVNAGLNYLMVFHSGLGLFGLTLGTSGVLLCNMTCLFAGLAIRHGVRLDYGRMALRLGAMAFAAAGMAACLWALGNLWASSSVYARAPAMVAAGGAAYFLLWWPTDRLLRARRAEARGER